MRFCFVVAGKVGRMSTILRALLCLALAVPSGCGTQESPTVTPPKKIVDVAVSGQTVTKARVAGSEIVVLEERLTSIFEDSPQRTVAILQSEDQTVQPYTPPAGWSVVDFAVHPSGDI